MILAKHYPYAFRFFIRYFVIILVLAFLLTSFNSKAGCFLLLNPVHTRNLDNFFVCYTYLGDGLFALLLFLIMLFYKQYLFSVQHMAAFLLSGIAAHVFKILIPAPRPKAFFEPGVYNGFIDGITHSGLNSFPSGHTTTAFAMATVLALHTNNRFLMVSYLLLAVSVGYSRIYLGQHFLEDIVAGAIIGVASGIVVFKWLHTIEIPWRKRGKPVIIRLT